jgi:hypothetical protein
LNFYIRLFVNVVCKWCRRLPNLSWGKCFGGFTVYCCRAVNYGRIYLLLLWCTQQLVINLPYCWLALQYIEESSSFIDWQFDCLFICLMFKKSLNKCHDKLAAKHIVLFCLASNKNSITMLHNCSSTNRKSCSHKVFLGYKLICNNEIY